MLNVNQVAIAADKLQRFITEAKTSNACLAAYSVLYNHWQRPQTPAIEIICRAHAFG
jgi:hypothetical protein